MAQYKFRVCLSTGYDATITTDNFGFDDSKEWIIFNFADQFVAAFKTDSIEGFYDIGREDDKSRSDVSE